MEARGTALLPPGLQRWPDPAPKPRVPESAKILAELQFIEGSVKVATWERPTEEVYLDIMERLDSCRTRLEALSTPGKITPSYKTLLKGRIGILVRELQDRRITRFSLGEVTTPRETGRTRYSSRSYTHDPHYIKHRVAVLRSPIQLAAGVKTKPTR